MKNEKRVIKMRAGLVFGTSLLLSMACGSRVNDNLGGETGFWETCKQDSECQSGLCACGVCTKACADEDECGFDDATCGTGIDGEDCTVDRRKVCVLKGDTTKAPSTSTGSSGIDAGTQEDVPTSVPTAPELPNGSPCDGFTCQVALATTSAGEVAIQVDFNGLFCRDACGLQRPTLHHVETGLRVDVGRGLDCSECLTLDPTGQCNPAEITGLTWNGLTRHLDSTCEAAGDEDLACQTQAKYAPPGRYRAEVCSVNAAVIDGSPQCPASGELRCESVEFDYPSTEAVVLQFDNVPGGDGGIENQVD